MTDGSSLTTLAAVNGLIRAALDRFLLRQIKDITGAYTLTPSDRGKILRCNGTFTVSVPQAATTPLGKGWWCDIRNKGTGVITLGGTGITWERGGSTLAQYAAATVVHEDTADTWSAVGELGT